MTPYDAYKFAHAAHADQKDKSGAPYINHVVRVTLKAQEYAARVADRWFRDDVTVAALLHDVVEDTPVTFEDLVMMINPNVLAILQLVTRDTSTGETYQQWIQTLCASRNYGAIIVKLADNFDNSLPERLATLPEAERSIEKRYLKARVFLQTAYDYHSRLP